MPTLGAEDERNAVRVNGRPAVGLGVVKQSTAYDPMAAVQEAAALRLRPILMTTSAMILGALPLALASGPAPRAARPSAE